MDLVRASHLYKVFGKHEREVIERLKAGESREDLASLGTAAVIDVSFEVAKAETFVVMGLSGSGKSTLIRMINGLWAPSEGTVEVAGKVVSDMNDAQLRELRRDHVSMVFQHFALLPHLTVRENAAYGLKLQGKLKSKDRLEKANEWLHTVGLKGWGDKYPHQLSGGMQQRVGLARQRHLLGAVELGHVQPQFPPLAAQVEGDVPGHPGARLMRRVHPPDGRAAPDQHPLHPGKVADRVEKLVCGESGILAQ